MKKIFAIFVILAVFIPIAAWAQKSSLFTDVQIDRIEEAIRSVYADTGVNIIPDHLWYGSCYICEPPNWQRDGMSFLIISNGSLRNRKLGGYAAEKRLESLEKKLELIFNPSASQELGRDLIK